MPTITLCMIVRENGNILGNCLESIKGYVDEIIVVDSFSTDETKLVASKYTDKIYDFDDPTAYLTDNQELFDRLGLKGEPTNEKFLCDYAAARNFSFSKATSDYIIWLDSDDIVKHPEEIRDIIKNMQETGVEAVRVNYDYAFGKDGKPAMYFGRERIVKNSPDIKWIYPGHEILTVPKGVEPYNGPFNVEHRHYEGGKKARSIKNKGFKILKNYVLNNEKVDARIYFYLGNESRSVSVEETIKNYEKYLEIGWWDEEIALVRASLGCIYENMGDYNKAWNYYAGSLFSFEGNPDGYFGLARVAYYKQMWDKCIQLTTLGFQNPFKGRLWTAGYSFNKNNPYPYLNLSLFKTGKVKEALEACKKGLEIDPSDKNMLHNKEVYEKTLTTEVLTQRPLGGPMVSGLADFCKKYIKNTDLVVEVGAYAGEGSVILAALAKQVVCVDPWENGYDDLDGASNTADKAEKVFDERVKEVKNITKIKGKSEDIVKKFDDGSVDVVYIDASHKYEDVKKDLQMWLPKVKNGGILSGHDYGAFEGVTRAVNEIIGKPQETFNDSSWMIIKNA